MQAQNPEVSGDKATTPATELRLVTVDQLKKIHRELDACQKVIWLAGCRPRVPGGFDPAYVTGAQEQLKVIEALMEKQTAAADALVPCGECIEGLRMIDPYDGGTFITCSRCNGRGMLTTCPTCFGAVPADRAHLLETEQAAIQWTNNKPIEPGAYWVRGFRIGEQDYRPALVEVACNEAGTLLCNMNDSNTNDDLREWSCVEDLAERFEWCGPLLAGDINPQLAEHSAEAFERNDQRTLTSTLLISDSHFAIEVTPELIASWSDAECQAVEDYCLAIHYKASDNPGVVIPPRPAVLGGAQ